MERTGEADPVRVIPLLWRVGTKPGRRGLTVDLVVAAAIELADERGIDQLSMRRLAERLGVGAMSLYSHVPGRAELLDLMVDQVHAEVDGSTPSATGTASGWRRALEGVAEDNRALHQRHPWLVDVDTSRPPLGPGTIAKYDSELRSLHGTGLTDVELDQTLTLVLDHVRANRRELRAAAATAGTAGPDLDWWERAGRVLAAVVDSARFPLATRVGAAAGQEYGAPTDPHRSYEFGLAVILDGIETLIARRG